VEASVRSWLSALATAPTFIHDRCRSCLSLIPKVARRGAPPYRKAARGAYLAEGARRGHLRDRHQLNRGADLITSRDEREQLGRAHLLAGQRAKATTAYASRSRISTAGAALLPEDSWERRHELHLCGWSWTGGMRVLTGALARRSSAWRRCQPARKYCGTSHGRVLAAWICTRPSIRAGRAIAVASRLPPASGHRTGRRIRREAEARREYERTGSQRKPTIRVS